MARKLSIVPEPRPVLPVELRALAHTLDALTWIFDTLGRDGPLDLSRVGDVRRVAGHSADEARDRLVEELERLAP